MALSTIRSAFTLITLMAAFAAAGFGLVASLYFGTLGGAIDVELPGAPINETRFSSLVSEEHDQAVFDGQFIQLTRRPYTLTFFPKLGPSEVTTDDEAADISRALIPARYMDRFNSYHVFRNPPLPSIGVRWEENPQGNGVIALTEINANTGVVYSYHVHWDPDVEALLGFEPINADGSPGNESIIQDRLISFMKLHGYSFPSNTRLIECAARPNMTHAMYYELRFGIVHGDVLMDEWYEGVFARVNAVTGEILDFRYQHIAVANMKINGAIEPEIAYQRILSLHEYDTRISHSQYLQHFLRLENIGTLQDADAMLLQLVWVFLFVDEGGYLWEIPADAFDGGKPGYIRNPDILYDLIDLRLASGGTSALIVAPVVTIAALAASACVYSMARRWVGKRSRF